jgi:hypothetical protein
MLLSLPLELLHRVLMYLSDIEINTLACTSTLALTSVNNCGIPMSEMLMRYSLRNFVHGTTSQASYGTKHTINKELLEFLSQMSVVKTMISQGERLDLSIDLHDKYQHIPKDISFPRLESLHVLSVTAVAYVSKLDMPRLTHLDIVHSTSMIEIIANKPSLRYVRVRHNGLDDAQMELLTESFPEVTIVFTVL